MADLQRVLVDGDDAAKAVALRAIDGMLAEGSMTTPEMVEFCKAAFSNEDEAVRATAEPIIRKYADKTTLAVLNFGILGSISIVGRSQAETAELARGHDRALSYLVLLARDRSFLVKKAFRDLDAASPPHALYGVKFLRELATYLPFVKQEFGKRFGI
jgi:hypothetical protein